MTSSLQGKKGGGKGTRLFSIKRVASSFVAANRAAHMSGPLFSSRSSPPEALRRLTTNLSCPLTSSRMEGHCIETESNEPNAPRKCRAIAATG